MNYLIRPVIDTCCAKLIPTGSVHYTSEWFSRLFGISDDFEASEAMCSNNKALGGGNMMYI
jgi:hypothetical protein